MAASGRRDGTCFQCTRKRTAPTSCVRKTRLTRMKNWKAAGWRSQRPARPRRQLARGSPLQPPLPRVPAARGHVQLLGADATSLSTMAARRRVENKRQVPGSRDAKEMGVSVLRKEFPALAFLGKAQKCHMGQGSGFRER